MPKTTIPETVEVPSDSLIEAIGFLNHLSDVVNLLNGRQTTQLNHYLDGASSRLFHAAFGREWDEGGELEDCIEMASCAFTKAWAQELAKEAGRKLQPA
jgi:hypothetical protein